MPAAVVGKTIKPTRLRDKAMRLELLNAMRKFGNQYMLPEFKKTWRDIVKPSLSPKEAAAVEREIPLAFSRVSDDIQAATRIPADRNLDPEEFLATCQLSFQMILGA